MSIVLLQGLPPLLMFFHRFRSTSTKQKTKKKKNMKFSLMEYFLRGKVFRMLYLKTYFSSLMSECSTLLLSHWQQKNKRHFKNRNIIRMEMSSQSRIGKMAALDIKQNVVWDLLFQKQKGTQNVHCDLMISTEKRVAI